MQSNLLFRIEEKMADLPQSEKKIAATILADPTAVIQMNIQMSRITFLISRLSTIISL